MATTEQPSAFIGQPIVRKEDPELITGRSRYVDDITVPGMLWAYIVRSPFAHARINGVDVSKALAMEGCVAAFSGADLASEWAGPLVCAWPVTRPSRIARRRDGTRSTLPIPSATASSSSISSSRNTGRAAASSIPPGWHAGAPRPSPATRRARR